MSFLTNQIEVVQASLLEETSPMRPSARAIDKLAESAA